MKRSEINSAIKWAEELLKSRMITLPWFAKKTPEYFKENEKECSLIKSTMLGWDVTDFGRGDFSKVGAVLFTVRNGNVKVEGEGTPYAEKYILLKDGCEQEIPMHYHITKTEDIINRGGGILCVQLCGRDTNDQPDMTTPVKIFLDGVEKEFKPTDIIEIEPGNSITLTPYVYHRFYAKTGAGDLVAGEVSKINDDNADNIFADKSERFCEIIEDEPRYRALVNEY